MKSTKLGVMGIVLMLGLLPVTSQAVKVNPDGMGEVLLYPKYQTDKTPRDTVIDVQTQDQQRSQNNRGNAQQGQIGTAWSGEVKRGPKGQTIYRQREVGDDRGFRGNDRSGGNREFRNRDRGFRDTGFHDRDRGDRRYHHRDRDFNDALPAAAFGLINAIVHDNDRKGRRHHDRRFINQDDTYRCKIFDEYRGRYVWSTCRR